MKGCSTLGISDIDFCPVLEKKFNQAQIPNLRSQMQECASTFIFQVDPQFIICWAACRCPRSRA
jgi:hypothetical protein